MRAASTTGTSPLGAPLDIWIVCTGEPSPLDGEHVRLFRAGLVGRELVARGHRVTWFASSFAHRSKAPRTPRPRRHDEPEIVLLPALGYGEHVSPRRLVDHAYVAWQFGRQARRRPRPDVIYASYPTLELSYAAARFASRRGVPLCLDVRDLWPDIFARAVPGVLRPIAAPVIAAYRVAGRHALASATAVVSVTDEMLSWGLHMAGRGRNSVDRAIPFPFLTETRSESEFAAATERLRQRGLMVDSGRPRLLYAGGLTRTLDLETLVAAFDTCRTEHPDLELVLCGAGDRAAWLRDAARGRPGLHLPGWVQATDLELLGRSSAAGLMPYRPTFDFEMSIPNKVAEYLYLGLPIIASFENGPVSRLIRTEAVGSLYRCGDVASLADAMLAAIAAWNARDRRPDQRCRDASRRRFSPEMTVQPLADLLAHLARR